LTCEEQRGTTRKGVVNCIVCAKAKIKTTKIYSNSVFTRNSHYTVPHCYVHDLVYVLSAGTGRIMKVVFTTNLTRTTPDAIVAEDIGVSCSCDWIHC